MVSHDISISERSKISISDLKFQNYEWNNKMTQQDHIVNIIELEH